MKRLSPRPFPLASFVCALACVILPAAAARADLDSDVKAVLQDKPLQRAKVGVQVLRLGGKSDDLKDLFGHDSSTPLIPASNLKLATTAAALDTLGPDFKFRTLLVKRGDDLVLIADGDPTFGDADFLRKHGWRVTTVYEGWAAQLKKLGITTVKDVVVDDSVFDEAFVHPNWPGGQWDYRYMAQVGGMNLNVNLVDVIVQPTVPGDRVSYTLEPSTRYVSIRNTCITGSQNAIVVARDLETNQIALKGQTPGRGAARVSATIHDPSLYAATVLSETLAAGGVNVTGTVRRDRTARAERAKELKGDEVNGGRWQLVGMHETPLPAALGRANKDSINVYAESFCKRLGHESVKTAPDPAGTWANGTAAVGAFLKRVGIPESDFRLDDGCGLSRQNVITPRALTRVLAYTFYARNRDPFVESLSVAGVDGTLEDRFRGSDLRHRVRGKSGYIDGVSTLSGYLYARDGQVYAFSIMMNGLPRASNADAKLLQERIVKAIDAEAAAAAAAK